MALPTEWLGCPAVWLAGWLADWLAGWLTGCLAGWLDGHRHAQLLLGGRGSRGHEGLASSLC